MAPTDGHGYASTYTEEEPVAGRTAYSEAHAYATAPGYAPERPLGEVFQELAQDARTLINLEVALAKAELTEAASKTGKSVGFMAAGGFVIYAGFLAIVFAIVAALANFIPLWLSALIVGVVVAVIGYVLVRKGMNDLKATSLAPKQTIDTLKEDKEWAQQQMR